jgi:4-hydroxy-tetrahydrodipicolinate reductase
VGDHVVMFAADGERVELAHKATGRGGLASGALRAAEWLATQRPGFHALRDMLGL